MDRLLQMCDGEPRTLSAACDAEGVLAAPQSSNLAIAPTEAYQHGSSNSIVPIVIAQIGSSAEGSP